MLTQYQNTYQDYISALNDSITNNQNNNGNQNGNNNQNNNGNQNVNSNQNNNSNSNDNSVSQYSSKLSNLNQQLLDINKQITDQINSSSSSYNTESQQRGQQNQVLDQNNSTLTNEKQQIKQLKKEFNTIEEANKNTQLILTQQYSRYIVLIFITILLVILLFKYAVTGQSQSGGSGKHFMNEAIFLFAIMVVFLGLAHVFDNINGYVLLTVTIISCIVTKLKMINTIK